MKVKVSRVGNNGKKINLPKAIWEKLKLETGDYVEFVINKKGDVKIIKHKS
ncbi:MAG: AbrB/MazE/SpoVT family DNA-binding domain-containing protein [Paraclostridium sp.]